MLMEAERGVREAGCETELIHLYDLKFTDCKSCFACKLKSRRQDGICVLRDDLRPVLEKAFEADGIIVGVPVYYGNINGQTLSFLSRLMFPLNQYEYDPATQRQVTALKSPKRTGLIVTMNASKGYVMNSPSNPFETERWMMELIFGHCDLLYAFDTYQFSDYSKYNASMWNEAQKRHQRDTQFPKDLQSAYLMGKTLLD